MEITYEDIALIFKALSDTRRLMILDLLKNGEECACLLGQQLDMAQSSLSYHMKILCDSGMVDSRQEGKWTHYKISEAGSKYALDLLRDMTATNVDFNKNQCI